MDAEIRCFVSFDRVVLTGQQLLLQCSSLTFLKQTDLQHSTNLILMHLQTCITFNYNLFWHGGHGSLPPGWRKRPPSPDSMFLSTKSLSKKDNGVAAVVIAVFLSSKNHVEIAKTTFSCLYFIETRKFL